MKRLRRTILEDSDRSAVPSSLHDRILGTETVSLLELGNRRIDECRRLMSLYDSWKGPRSKNQLMFCEAILRTCACYLYGSVFDQEKATILRRNKWVTCYSAMVLQAPRREGKSEMVKLAGAVILYVMRSAKFLIVVPEAAMGDKATGLLGGMRHILMSMLGIDERQVTSDNNKIFSFVHEGTERRIQMESNRWVKKKLKIGTFDSLSLPRLFGDSANEP